MEDISEEILRIILDRIIGGPSGGILEEIYGGIFEEIPEGIPKGNPENSTGGTSQDILGQISK